MYAFALALQFLTRIPVPFGFVASDRQLGQSVLFYPLIGLLIGAVLGLLAFSLGEPASGLKAALVLTTWVWLSGGLHLDGLADCADAWVGGLGSRERSLEIMKDPAAGPSAVVLLVLVLLLKWAALLAVLENRLPEAMIVAPVLGRLAIVALMFSTSYVRKAGLGEKLVQNLPVRSARILTAVCWLGAIPFAGFLPVLTAGFAVIGVRYLAIRRIGGATGDVYGAAVELTEAAVLVAVAL